MHDPLVTCDTPTGRGTLVNNHTKPGRQLGTCSRTVLGPLQGPKPRQLRDGMLAPTWGAMEDSVWCCHAVSPPVLFCCALKSVVPCPRAASPVGALPARLCLTWLGGSGAGGFSRMRTLRLQQRNTGHDRAIRSGLWSVGRWVRHEQRVTHGHPYGISCYSSILAMAYITRLRVHLVLPLGMQSCVPLSVLRNSDETPATPTTAKLTRGAGHVQAQSAAQAPPQASSVCTLSPVAM